MLTILLFFIISLRIRSKSNEAPTILGTVPRNENHVFPIKINAAAGAIASISAIKTVKTGFISVPKAVFSERFIKNKSAADRAMAAIRYRKFFSENISFIPR